MSPEAPPLEGDNAIYTLKDAPPVHIKIDGTWYDATGYAMAHPGGARFVRFFHGRDATDVFYALHSYGPNGATTAKDRLSKLRVLDGPPAGVRDMTEVEAATSGSFRAFRKKLEEDGWFERNPVHEVRLVAQTLGLYVAGTMLAATQPILATILIGVGMQQGGWLAHDFVHGRGRWCSFMRLFGAFTNGFSSDWWTQKHSMHHSFTNEEHKDEDIMQEPFFYLQDPAKTGRPDSPFRKFQHIYGYPLYMITFWLWRFDSLRSIVRRRDLMEGAAAVVQYAWLFAVLPLPVALASVSLGGFLCGAIVSATHQSEEIMDNEPLGPTAEYVDAQFRSTRDAQADDPISKFFWGGMDTQLEHHLFPSMPRYRYHKLRPLLQAWAAKTPGVDYKISPWTTIIRDNWLSLRAVARA